MCICIPHSRSFIEMVSRLRIFYFSSLLIVLSFTFVTSFLPKDHTTSTTGLLYNNKSQQKKKYVTSALLLTNEESSRVIQSIESTTTNNQKQVETSTSLNLINGLDQSSSELNALLNKMPLTDKYSILIESYAKELSQSFPKKSENFQLIESLYSEMVEKAVIPTDKATFSFLNAASLFCNSAQLGQSIQLIKSGL